VVNALNKALLFLAVDLRGPLVEVDPARQAMLFHVIDASDPDAVRDQLDRFCQRYQRRVFP
jgi:multisubunit Na+/H+ antiporter MnhE subunit